MCVCVWGGGGGGGGGGGRGVGGLMREPGCTRYQDLQEIIAIYLRWPSSWHYLDLFHRADESQNGRNGCLRL